MKLKIALGKLSYVDQFSPIKQQDFEANSPQEAMESFKKFFTDNPELSLPQDVELILQSGDPMTVSTILSIKYYLGEQNLGLEYYAYDDSDTDDSILDNITLANGMLLLDDAQKFYGFIPRGFFLRFSSEEDANPIKVYSWINDTVRLFPSVSSDPFTTALDQVKEYAEIMGTISNSTMNKLSKILSQFSKRAIIL